ncbi:MAG: hypothetical protein JWN30_2672 [Bacilli bacterium]|nr:hypothetical protein [Bacilli bacterium]
MCRPIFCLQPERSRQISFSDKKGGTVPCVIFARKMNTRDSIIHTKEVTHLP